MPKPNGFTLIETMVAIFVLMVAIAGPLTLASKGLQATLTAKDQETAYYLAQDAVEYVRWARDTNKLKGSTWLAGLDGTANGHTNNGGAGGTCTGASGCNIDSLQDTTTSCSGTCAALNFDSTNNYYSYTSGTASIYTRTVKIVTPVGTNNCTTGHACEASVNVTVTWSDQAGIQRKIAVNESIFDWQ